MGERVPQHVQNIVIRDFCQRKNLHYLISEAEYAIKNCYLILENILEDLNNLDGIIAYSIFQLPENKKNRYVVYQKIIDQKKIFYFAVEDLKLDSIEQCQVIEDLWGIRVALSNYDSYL
jgi:sporadic carbohydrate cluster protein (TIGR04323 family)